MNVKIDSSVWGVVCNAIPRTYSFHVKFNVILYCLIGFLQENRSSLSPNKKAGQVPGFLNMTMVVSLNDRRARKKSS